MIAEISGGMGGTERIGCKNDGCFNGDPGADGTLSGSANWMTVLSTKRWRKLPARASSSVTDSDAILRPNSSHWFAHGADKDSRKPAIGSSKADPSFPCWPIRLHGGIIGFNWAPFSKPLTRFRLSPASRSRCLDNSPRPDHRLHTARHLGPQHQGQPNRRVLNTKGIYSLVRHPLYSGNYFMWLGIMVYVSNVWFVVVCSLIHWLYERIMFAEEAFLRGKFGQAYLDWSVGVPFWPRSLRWTAPDVQFSLRNVLKREYNFGFAISATSRSSRPPNTQCAAPTPG